MCGSFPPAQWYPARGTTSSTPTGRPSAANSPALLGMALFAGAGLACLVFVLERVIRSGAGWISEHGA